MRGQGTQRKTDKKTLTDRGEVRGDNKGQRERGRDIHRQAGGEVEGEENGHIERQTQTDRKKGRV